MAQRRVGPTTTRVAMGMEEARQAGGGIVPGAHPEMEKGTTFGNPFEQIGGLIKRLFPKPKPIGNSSRDAHNLRAWEFDKAQRDSAKAKR